MPNRNQVLISILCLLFAFAGGIGGYHLKSRLINADKPGDNPGLSVINQTPNISKAYSNADHECDRPVTLASVSNTSASVSRTLPAYDGNKQSIKKLVKSIHAIARQQGIKLNLTDQAKTEIEFVNLIDESPVLIDTLLTVYQHLSIDETKTFLRSLLVTSGSDLIEQRGIHYLMSGKLENRSDWLELLRDSGVHGQQSRNDLLNLIPALNQPNQIHDALLAIVPEVVSNNERLQIINQLELYSSHNNDMVRTAAINSLGKWAGKSHAYVLEQALNDTSNRVRFEAISTAFSSSIRSDYIQSMLLDIMNNNSEDWQIRIHAHTALSNYSLQGQGYEQYYQFHQELLAINNTEGPKG